MTNCDKLFSFIMGVRELQEKKSSASAGLPAAGVPEWAQLPGIPLYMDQVILYLREALCFFEQEGGAPLLTSSMINNYVKNGVLPHPEKKKYGRAHLGALLMICMLKPVLSLQQIKELLGTGELTESAYESFRREQEAAVTAACAELQDEPDGAEDLRKAALRMALRANAERAAAQRFFGELAKKQPAGQCPPEKAPKEKSAKKEKKGEKSRT